MKLSTNNNVLRSLQMLDDSTVEIVFNDDVTIEIEDIKQTYIYLHEFTNGHKLKKIVVTGKNTKISKEARLFGYSESLKIKDKVIAEAIIVHSLYQKMIINFYTRFIKDSYPTKYFTDSDKAKAWLQSY